MDTKCAPCMQLVFNLILKEKDDFGLKGCQGKLKGVKAKTLIKPHLRVLSGIPVSRNWFKTVSNFLIPISLQTNVVDLKQFPLSGCKDIGIK